MLTTTSEYAIRAMIHITQNAEQGPVLAREIAAATGVPANYISKILRDLAHEGILHSTRGVGGGFRLARPARHIAMADIVTLFESSSFRNRCPFGMPACTEDTPCGAHEYWRGVKQAYDKFLDRTTLAVVAAKSERATSPPRRRSPART
jgi:Rrf2 family protein